jgi:hypothetical protein
MPIHLTTSFFPPLVPGSTTVPWGSHILISSVMVSCLARWKCSISDLASSNVTALSHAHWKAVLAGASSYLFIYLFVINACNLKVMARFTELNNRTLSFTLGSRWALSQYRSSGVGPDTPNFSMLKVNHTSSGPSALLAQLHCCFQRSHVSFSYLSLRHQGHIVYVAGAPDVWVYGV